MDRTDFPIPIADTERDSPWPTPQVEPINLITLLPTPAEAGDQPQITLSEALAALSRVMSVPFTIIEQPPPPDERVKWVALIAGPSQPAPMVIWLEPVRPMTDENIRFLKAEGVRWIVGIETALQHERAHEHLLSLLQLLGRAFPDSPAILNANTGAWFPREELDSRLLPEATEVSPALCFVLHGISAGAAPDRVWYYTDGLRTTGRAELEMHGVPLDDGRGAGYMLNAITELVYEGGLPPPGEPYEVGLGLVVRFMPAEESAAAADASWLGSVSKREDHDGRPLAGARVAICAPHSLLWPAEAMQKINSGEAALYKTRQATEREARLARRTLDHFGDLFSMLPAARRDDSPQRLAAFLIKAGFVVPNAARDDADSDREHLWFEALRCEPGKGRIRGRLLNEPRAIAHLREGQDIWIDRNLVSDWQVITQRARYGPDEHAQARQTLEELLRETSHA